MKKTTIILSLLTILLLNINHQLLAQVPLLLPKGTIEGKLENGLSYIILKNPNPIHKMELRLIFRIGANQESESQRGAAHFLEHMAFAGTKNFPNRGIVEYFESIGMKYGRDINAVTGYDRTIYMLSVPLDKNPKEVSQQSINVLKDWLCNISFDAERTKRERGVILEELRGYDLGDDLYDLKIGNNRFSKRMPLGSTEDISSISRDKLLEFYNTWYSPCLATVMVIGDINPKEIELEIKNAFNPIKCKDIKGKILYPLDYDKGIKIKEIKDTLGNSSSIEIMIPHSCTVSKCIYSACAKEMGNVLLDLLYQRFKIQNIKASFFNNWYLSDKEHFGFNVSGRNKKELLEIISQSSCELAQICKDGFLKEEIMAVLAKYAKNYNKLPDTQTSAALCDDLIDYVISKDIHISFKEQKDSVLKMLQEIPASQYKSLLSLWLSEMKNTTLVAYRNNNINDSSLSETELIEAWQNGERAEYKGFTFKEESEHNTKKSDITIACLETEKPYKEEYIKSKKEYSNLGISQIQLTNGITLILKPTQDSDRKILLSSFAKGGTAWINADKHYQLEGVGAYMDMNGIADVNYDTLADYLYENEISVSNAIEGHWNGFLGAAPSDKHKQLFNLIYEKSFHPQLNHKEFEEIKADELENFGKETVLDKMLKRSPDRLLREKQDKLLGNFLSNTKREKSKKDIEKLNLDSIAAFHTKLSAITEGKTFIICGNFNSEDIIKSFVSVFGALKPCSLNKQMDMQMPKFELPAKTYKEEFENMNPSQTVFDYFYFGHFESGLKNTLELKIIRDLLQSRVLSVLRERESIVYSPYASLFYNGFPNNIYYFDISASIERSNSKKCKKLIDEIITELYDKPIGEDELNGIKRSFIITKNETLAPDASSAWKGAITTMLRNGESLEDFNNYDSIINSISTKDINNAIKKYINKNKYLLLHLGKFEE